MSYTGSLAAAGTGSLLSCSTTLGGTYDVVGEPTGDFALQIKNMFEDTTNQQSSGMETLGIFADYPRISVECNRVPTDVGQIKVRTAALANTKLYWKYQIVKMGTQTTSGDLYAFAAYVEDFTEKTPVNKKGTTMFTLKITNGLTLTPGT